MSSAPLQLLFNNRSGEDQDALAIAASRRTDVEFALVGSRAPLSLVGKKGLRIYGEPLFADVVAGQLQMALIEAPSDWMATLPFELVNRSITKSTLGEVRQGEFPVFVQSVNKGMRSGVHSTPKYLADAGLVGGDEVVLVSDPVEWDQVIRLFVLDAEVRTGSTCGRWPTALAATGSQQRVETFVASVIERMRPTLPPSFVMDIGHTSDDEWSVVSVSSPATTPLLACNAGMALDVILAASVSGVERAAVSPEFLRPSMAVSFGPLL